MTMHRCLSNRLAVATIAVIACTLLHGLAAHAGETATPPRLTVFTQPASPGGNPASRSTRARTDSRTQASLLWVDADAVRSLRAAGRGRVALPLPGGKKLELVLSRSEVLSPGAVVTATGAGGPVAVHPDFMIYRATVDDDSAAWAVLGFAGDEVLGVVESRAGRFEIAPDRSEGSGLRGGPRPHVISAAQDLTTAAAAFECRSDALAPPIKPERSTTSRGPLAEASSTRLVCNAAIDCDYEFYANKFGSNVTNATNYMLTVMGVVSAIYERELNVSLRVSYLNLWTTASDPYTRSSIFDQLLEFQAYWGAHRGGVSRDIAHLVSGRPLGGGMAYLDVLCDMRNAYGVSALDGNYSYPTNTPTWDAVVLAHEMGHNFGSSHTQSCFWQANGYVAPGGLLDSCWTAEGTCYSGPTRIMPANKGTLMSYCHLLAGVANGLRLEFHSACRSLMRQRAESCLGTQDPVVTAPATAGGAAGSKITVTVNAADPDGDPITSLTADLSGLPAGSAATFVPGPGNTTGTLTWTPAPTDARSAPYSVSFTAANGGAGSATTAITVTDPNLVTNPSFESSTTGWGSYLGSTLARVAGGHDGAYSLAVRGPTTTSVFGVNDAPDWVNPVAAVGTRYRYTAWVRSESATGSAQLQVRELIGGVQRGSTVRSPAVTLSRTWQMITADYVATTAGTSLNLQIVDTPAAPGEAFQVDEVSIAMVPGLEIPNFVTNPSFEFSTGGWGSYVGSTIARVAGGHDGAYSLAVRGPTTTTVFGVNDAPDWVNPVAAVGTRYRFTAWVRSQSATGSAQLQVREFIGGVQKGFTIRSWPVTLSNTWQMITADYAATYPGTSLNLQIIDTPDAPGEVFQVDEVSIVTVPGAAASDGGEAPGDGRDAALAGSPAGGTIRAAVSPNPLATMGSLSFTTARAGFARVQVFDVRGRIVRTLTDAADLQPGRHVFALDGRDDAGARLPAGVYYYRVVTPEAATTGRFLLVR